MFNLFVFIMKKNFWSALAGFFGRKRKQSEKTSCACELKTEESSERDRKNGILRDIYFSLRYGRYSQALEKIQEYLCDFGILNGNDRACFNEKPKSDDASVL